MTQDEMDEAAAEDMMTNQIRVNYYKAGDDWVSHLKDANNDVLEALKNNLITRMGSVSSSWILKTKNKNKYKRKI